MKIDKLEKKNRQTINYSPDAKKKKDRERKKHYKNHPHSAWRKINNSNNKKHKTQEPTHVEETCTDTKDIKKRRNFFYQKKKIRL